MTEREITELFARPLDPDTEERALREELATMMRRHAAARQPIVDRIIQLQAMKPVIPSLISMIPTASAPPSYQDRVGDWMSQCFTPEICNDRMERNHRFLEEAIELVQATGCTASEAHQLVDYVFGRPIGEPGQEVGGVMVTLAAACNAFGISMSEEAERELARILDPQIMEKIRRKQAAKPKHSPLPE